MFVLHCDTNNDTDNNNANHSLIALDDKQQQSLNLLRNQLRASHFASEEERIATLLEMMTPFIATTSNNGSQLQNAQASDCLVAFNDEVSHLAKRLITKVRHQQNNSKTLSANKLLQKFKLSTIEGAVLMCLAESLLRIPDKYIRDKLIADKVTQGDWLKRNLASNNNLFANLSSWGLFLAGKVLSCSFGKTRQSTIKNNQNLGRILTRVLASYGAPIIRFALRQAVQMLGNQFVLDSTIEKALLRASKNNATYTYSFDMLGEAALTSHDAKMYLASYEHAIRAVGKANRRINANTNANSTNSTNQQTTINHTQNDQELFDYLLAKQEISIKLSALYPKYNRAHLPEVMSDLYPKLVSLYKLALTNNVSIFIDAEEANRLDISLSLFERLVLHKELQDFTGFGFVVQAYQKCAPYLIDYIAELAKITGIKLQIRLVKGAYWDSEIKEAQLEGIAHYPVYTRKFHTDVSYLACAYKLFTYQKQVYPFFATHNIYTIASIYTMAGNKRYAFQGLHGMAEDIYDYILSNDNTLGLILNKKCRIYAPIGEHKTLLPYLVRRMLENGANSSFIYQVVDKTVTTEQLLLNPLQLAKLSQGCGNPRLPLPRFIYDNNRLNAKGFNLSDELILKNLTTNLNLLLKKQYKAKSLIANSKSSMNNEWRPVYNPSDHHDIVGEVVVACQEEVEHAIIVGNEAYSQWYLLGHAKRAQLLFKVADLLESDAHYTELLALLVREAGKTLANAVSEVREAIDFCRYYANIVSDYFTPNQQQPLGLVVAISPWNFPLAIFVGEVSSALVVGNSVIAKPAMQTSIIAHYVIQLFHQAGVPTEALQLLIGSGAIIGDLLTKDSRVKGVIFTGSTSVAATINQNLLLSRVAENVILPPANLIAETGGQNAMIVDSTALAEQVVNDVVRSAFDSAGQRCSALRVLYLQEEVANIIITMLVGAMQLLNVGNPYNLATDVGPVIDENAKKSLLKHIDSMQRLAGARIIYQTPLNQQCASGTFVPPTLIELDTIDLLKQEVFGPIVHVIRYKAKEYQQVIAAINSTGYGLTQGVHSRVDSFAKDIYMGVAAGNIYVNRNMVGAVVGVQPFGGCGLSGTGPKAGGALYLYRLVHNQCMPHVLRETNDKLLISNDTSHINKMHAFMQLLPFLGFTGAECASLSRFADWAIIASLLHKKINLVGATGESNFLFFVKRGIVGCFAGNRYEYALQIISSLATGNKILLLKTVYDKLFNHSLIQNNTNTNTNTNTHRHQTSYKILGDSIEYVDGLADLVRRINVALLAPSYDAVSDLISALVQHTSAINSSEGTLCASADQDSKSAETKKTKTGDTASESIVKTSLANNMGLVLVINTPSSAIIASTNDNHISNRIDGMRYNEFYYPLYLLTLERSVSVNTTVNGGNFALMTLTDDLYSINSHASTE